MKTCPHCRLPAPPAEIFTASTEGVPFVFGLCRRCSDALKLVPPATRQKAITRAYLRVLDRPDMHYHRAFESEEKARLFHALGADPLLAAGVVAELMG